MQPADITIPRLYVDISPGDFEATLLTHSEVSQTKLSVFLVDWSNNNSTGEDLLVVDPQLDESAKGPGSTHNIATAKLGIGTRLRKETTLPIKAMAARLHLGTFKSANIRLYAG